MEIPKTLASVTLFCPSIADPKCSVSYILVVSTSWDLRFILRAGCVKYLDDYAVLMTYSDLPATPVVAPWLTATTNISLFLNFIFIFQSEHLRLGPAVRISDMLASTNPVRAICPVLAEMDSRADIASYGCAWEVLTALIIFFPFSWHVILLFCTQLAFL